MRWKRKRKSAHGAPTVKALVEIPKREDVCSVRHWNDLCFAISGNPLPRPMRKSLATSYPVWQQDQSRRVSLPRNGWQTLPLRKTSDHRRANASEIRKPRRTQSRATVANGSCSSFRTAWNCSAERLRASERAPSPSVLHKGDFFSSDLQKPDHIENSKRECKNPINKRATQMLFSIPCKRKRRLARRY